MIIEGTLNGKNDVCKVSIDGKEIKPTDYTQSRYYKPEFQWGHPGPACRFLAWAILFVATDPRTADSYCQTFKWLLAQRAFGKPFKTELDINDWIDKQEQYQKRRYPITK